MRAYSIKSVKKPALKAIRAMELNAAHVALMHQNILCMSMLLCVLLRTFAYVHFE